MARIEHANKGTEATRLPAGKESRSWLKATFLFNRPILVGVLAVLASLICCQAYGQDRHQSYQTPSYAQASVVSPAGYGDGNRAYSSDSSGVPLLFLSVLGLAGMALSRTGPSKNAKD